jgi:hypothetical protein
MFDLNMEIQVIIIHSSQQSSVDSTDLSRSAYSRQIKHHKPYAKDSAANVHENKNLANHN